MGRYGGGDIVDPGKATNLLPIAEDRHGLAGQRRGDESRDHCRVLGIGVLARPEDVEVAQRYGRKPVARVERLEIPLPGELVGDLPDDVGGDGEGGGEDVDPDAADDDDDD